MFFYFRYINIVFKKHTPKDVAFSEKNNRCYHFTLFVIQFFLAEIERLFILRTFTINYEISKLHRENSSFVYIWYILKTTNNCNKWYLRKYIWFKERYTHREQLLIDRQLNYFFSQKYLWRNLGHWFMLNNATVN